MSVFVARIERPDEGTYAYAFEAVSFRDADVIAKLDLVDERLGETLIEVLTIEEFLNGNVYELCTC